MNGASSRSMILMGQVFMLVLALILAVAPQLYLVALIAYFVVVLGISFVRARGSQGRVDRSEVERARTLLKEDKALDLAVEDSEYVSAVSKQVKATFIPLLLFPLYIYVFRSEPLIENLIKPYIGASEALTRFIAWVIVFELLFAINQVLRIVIGAVEPAPAVPAAYRVTSKGILTRGPVGGVIGFPLPEGTEVRLNEEKNYVEIRLPKGNKIRLYTRKARRLYEIIQQYGLATGGRKEERSGEEER